MAYGRFKKSLDKILTIFVNLGFFKGRVRGHPGTTKKSPRVLHLLGGVPGAENLSQVGFEPTTHALKGRCSTN